MHFEPWTLALQTINFLILVWLLRRFLYAPVLRMIDARKADVQRNFVEAHAAEDKAKCELAALQADHAKIATERDAVLEAATLEAQRAATARRDQAERDAGALLEAGRKALAAERERALEDAQRIAFDLGTEIAQRLLADMPPALRAEAWLQGIVQHLKAMSSTERDRLIHQLADGAIVVSTAVPLSTDAASEWRDRLRESLARDAIVEFKTDPTLIAGAELHFPAAVLHFSWSSASAALRKEFTTHADAV